MIADTAELAVVLKLRDQLSGGLTAAESRLAAFDATATRASVGGLTRLQTAAKGVEGALGHAKSQISGLIGGFGLLAGAAAGAGILAFFKTGIDKATSFGAEVRQLTAISGQSAETMSALAAGLEHFGVTADTTQRLVGFLEKNVGLLAAKKDGIAGFEKTFGLALTDSNGQLKNANDLILASADYFNNKMIPASEKAAALSKLYGRSWQELIPVLSAGSAQLAAAEKEAADLGMTLTGQNLQDLVKLRDATRTWGDALGGLQLQIGLLLVGPLTDLTRAATSFVRDNRDSIIGGFKSLLSFAREVGGAITTVVIPAIKMIGGVWNSLPSQIRELLIGGFLVNKAVKWTFGIDVAGLAGGALKGAIEGLFKNATTAQMNVAAGVVNVAGGGLPGGAVGGGAANVAEGAGGAAIAETGWAAGGLAGLAAVAASVLGSAAVAAGIITLENNLFGITPADIKQANTHGQFGPRSASNLPPAAVPPGSRITTPTNLSGTAMDADRRAALSAQDFGPATLYGVNQLSGGLSAQLAGGRVGAAGVGYAASLVEVFKNSTAPSLRSMDSALGQLKTLQQRYLSQGDTKLAAAITSDINGLKARVDAVTAEINAKQFVAQTLATAMPWWFKDPNSGPVTVKVNVSAKQNQTASGFQNRWGPTPLTQGAQ